MDSRNARGFAVRASKSGVFPSAATLRTPRPVGAHQCGVTRFREHVAIKAPMRWRRIRFLAVYALFLLLLLEGMCRLFWWISGVSSPNRIHHFWYPRLKEVEAQSITRDDGAFDVLVLGGSAVAVHENFGDVPGKLEKRLAATGAQPVRVHAVAGLGHTTLDSYYKYRHLSDQRFDLVLVYNGINDARANNCPPERFRDDYGHWGWYKLVGDYEAKESRLFFLPYTLNFSVTKIGGKLGLIRFVPKEVPGEEWLVHGSDIKTERTFRVNLGRICDLAKERGDPLLLMTYAIHLPEGYTLDRFLAGELDYAHKSKSPIELWGKPANVSKAVAAHNRVVRDLARQRGLHLVDQDREMPRDGWHFGDVCHLTEEGARRFVDDIMRVVERYKLGPSR